MSQPAKVAPLFRTSKGAFFRIFVSLASLRLTVTLFALSIFIILVGTLAQTQKNMWDVRVEYFHTWWSWIELQVFFSGRMVSQLATNRGRILFPGRKNDRSYHGG